MLVEQCKGDLELCIQTLLDDTREAGPCPPLLPTLKERRLTVSGAKPGKRQYYTALFLSGKRFL